MQYKPFTHKLISQNYYDSLNGTLPKRQKILTDINTNKDDCFILTVVTEIEFNSLKGEKMISKMKQVFEIPFKSNDHDIVLKIPEIVYRAYATHSGWISAKEEIIMNSIPSLYEISKNLNATPLV